MVFNTLNEPFFDNFLDPNIIQNSEFFPSGFKVFSYVDKTPFEHDSLKYKQKIKRNTFT